jgi:hypothetical protein
MQDIATENFQRIREAYEILSDERKRQIYDLYGMEGLSSGLELGPKLKSREEVRAEFERLQQRQQERKLAAHVHHRGSLLMNLSLVQFLKSYDAPRISGLGSLIRPPPMGSYSRSSLLWVRLRLFEVHPQGRLLVRVRAGGMLRRPGERSVHSGLGSGRAAWCGEDMAMTLCGVVVCAAWQ